jgi:hypothetical protein
MSAAEALLQKVTEDRDRRCATVRAAAESQAGQIVHASRAAALRSVRSAVTQERARLEFGLRQATARADIEVRRQEQQTSRKLLGQMWSALGEVLTRRWGEAALQRAWIEAAMGEAGRLLTGRAWTIESGAQWTPPQREALLELARAHGARSVECAADAAMPAGLRIRAERVCIDATVPGLLAQRAAIEATFLAEYLPEQHTDG